MLDRLDTARLTASSDTAHATLATAVNRAADRPMAPVSRATRIPSGARAGVADYRTRSEKRSTS
jgi:hypothetical protein